MTMTQNRRRIGIDQKEEDLEEFGSRNGEKRPQHITRSSTRRNLATSLALLFLVGFGNRDAVVVADDESPPGPSAIAQYCLGPTDMSDNSDGGNKECFKLLPSPFQGDEDDGAPTVTVDSSVELGLVCLEVVQTNEGNMELEVDYQIGEGWAMKEGHLWFGTSVGAAPLMLHYSHNGDGKKISHKLPDATRFPYHTDLEELNDPKLQTTTVWDEVIQANDLIMCHSKEDETPEETGMRTFAAQAVLWSPYDDVVVTAFAALSPQDNFETLEDYFVVCACPDATVETADGEGDSTDQQEKSLDEQVEEQEREEIHGINSLMHLEDELTEALEEEEEPTNEEETTTRDESNSQDPDGASANPTESPSSSDGDSKDENEEDKKDHEEEGPVGMVKADELEIATSFMVVIPDQKHYLDVSLDEKNLHETEEQIEASPELHKAWHDFVKQLMSDHNIPSVNISEEAIDHARHERRLKPVTLEWIEDSPDLFRFLITTPCPANVLDERHVDMGSSPKALVRGSSGADGSSSKATCYKAFGKYKVLHLHSDDNFGLPDQHTSEDETSVDKKYDMEGEQSQQEVCYEIFHMTRQELAENRLGQELPDDSTFIIHGGKPESCLPTGYSTMVPKPEDIASLDGTTEDHDSSIRRKKEPLYELRNDDGSLDILSVMELVAYLTTSLLMMSLCITIYCCLLPKIELESRNRVTDDWSHPSLRPQRISSKRSKSKRGEPDFFPWLD